MKDIKEIMAAQNEPEVKEEPVIETPDKETVVQAVAEEPPKTEEPKKDISPETQEIGISQINEVIGEKFESIDQIKEAIKASKDAAVKAEYKKEIETLKEEISSLQEKADPKNIFGSTDNYKNYLYQQKAVELGKDPGVMKNVLTKDFSKLNDLENATLNMQFETGFNVESAAMLVFDELGINERDAIEAYKERYNTDDAPEVKVLIDDIYKNLTHIQSAKLGRLAKQSIKEMNEFRNIEIPEITDYNKSLEDKIASEKQSIDAIKQGVNNYQAKIVEYLDKVVLGDEKEPFEYDIPKSESNAAIKDIQNYLIANNLEVNDSNIEKAAIEWKEEYARLNWRKISKAWRDQGVSSLTEKHIQDTENPTPVNTQENAEFESDEIKETEAQRNAFKQVGLI